jgi:D-alanyl-D-alanine carboxypeptidase/D-alanyl-D-alanine-endopeptidase (penicillin-binding protein 4)
MRRLGLLGVLFLSAPASAQDAAAPALEAAVAAAERLGARTGVAVCDGEGRLLYEHRAREAFVPASNLKVLTAMAVLDGLGADFEFRTVFRLRSGRLAVEASGDPNLISDTVHAPEVVFGAVAAGLQQLGVTSIGGIDLDAGTFTGPSRPATWPQDQLYTYYCAPTGPFVLEQGTLAVAIEAAAQAAEASVRLAAPPADVPLRGSIEIIGKSKDAAYGALDLGDAVRVNGRFPRSSPPVTIRSAVRDPARWYEAALRKSLADAGIAIGEAAEVGDRVVYEHRSNLEQAVLRMLEDSSNFDAEQCVRVLGAKIRNDGSLAGGLAAMKAQLEKRLGTVPAGVVIVDGSGLSRENLVTPGLLVVALYASHGGPGGAVLRECLPVAGASGTLSDRFTGTNLVGRVRGKTGWIRGASSLSGVVERADGGVRWFSILMNYDRRKNGLNKDLKALQEKIVAAVDAMEPDR